MEERLKLKEEECRRAVAVAEANLEACVAAAAVEEGEDEKKQREQKLENELLNLAEAKVCCCCRVVKSKGVLKYLLCIVPALSTLHFSNDRTFTSFSTDSFASLNNTATADSLHACPTVFPLGLGLCLKQVLLLVGLLVVVILVGVLPSVASFLTGLCL